MNERNLYTPDQKLMALSWKQPYGELMLHGKIETRTWNTNYRGWVLICASKTGYKLRQVLNISGNDQFKRIFEAVEGKEADMYKFRGHAIAIGLLVDCRPMRPLDADQCFVEYYPDLFCHVYENVRAINPIPWKGTQGWREVSEEIKKQIVFI